jgi:hypothetical protein
MYCGQLALFRPHLLASCNAKARGVFGAAQLGGRVAVANFKEAYDTCQVVYIIVTEQVLSTPAVSDEHTEVVVPLSNWRGDMKQHRHWQPTHRVSARQNGSVQRSE